MFLKSSYLFFLIILSVQSIYVKENKFLICLILLKQVQNKNYNLNLFLLEEFFNQGDSGMKENKAV